MFVYRCEFANAISFITVNYLGNRPATIAGEGLLRTDKTKYRIYYKRVHRRILHSVLFINFPFLQRLDLPWRSCDAITNRPRLDFTLIYISRVYDE